MTYTPPWSPHYTSTSNPVPPNVTIPWKEDPVTDFTPTPTPAPTAPVTPTGDFVSQLEAELIAAAKGAAQRTVAALEAQALDAVKTAIPAAPTAPTLNLNDLTNAAARDRALRSLVYGVLLTAFWAVVSVAGSFSGIDWFSKTGWISVATLLAGTIGHAVLSYLGRIKFAPNAPE